MLAMFRFSFPTWRKVSLVILLAFVVGGAWFVFRGSTADERARTYFRIRLGTAVGPDSIREAFLRDVPLGSTETKVREFVDGSDIGKDGLSEYYPPDKQGQAVIRVELDPRTLGLVKKEYCITLRFDIARTLQSVEVDEWFTGP
jgi:hypothetical protein